MKLPWKWGCSAALTAVLAMILLLGFHREGGWTVAETTLPVQILDPMSHDAKFASRRTLWLADPPRIVSIPSHLVGLEGTSASRGGRVLIFPLDGGRVQSVPTDAPALSDGRLLELARPISGDHRQVRRVHGMRWLVRPDGAVRAAVTFRGVHFSYPWYNAGGLFGGTPGWEWIDSFTGRVELRFARSDGSDATAALEQTVINVTHLQEVRGNGEWIVGGRFFLFAPPQYGADRIFVVGPFTESNQFRTTD